MDIIEGITLFFEIRISTNAKRIVTNHEFVIRIDS